MFRLCRLLLKYYAPVPIICKRDLRTMLSNTKFNRPNEQSSIKYEICIFLKNVFL